MDIIYRGFKCKENEELVRKVVEKEMVRFPFWVRNVDIVFSANYPSDFYGQAVIECLYEYKSIQLVIFECFFTENEEKQGQIIRHEFTHSLVHPMKNWMVELLEKTLKERNPELYEIALEELNKREESLVQELVYLEEKGVGNNGTKKLRK